MDNQIPSESAAAPAPVKRVGFVGQMWRFMKVRKKWWLAPLIIILCVFAVLLVVAQSSPLAPFIYTIF